MTDLRLAGAYAEVLGSTTPDTKVAGSYAEVLGSTTPAAKVAGSYAEVLGSTAVDRKFVAIYVEVLVKGEAFGVGSNVFDVSSTEHAVWRWDGTNLIPAKLLQ